jgi:hypothetical protein
VAIPVKNTELGEIGTPAILAFASTALIAVGIFILSKKVSKVILNLITGWTIGFALGAAYIQIFDPHEAQGIILPLIWTGPGGAILYVAITSYLKKKKTVKESA